MKQFLILTNRTKDPDLCVTEKIQEYLREHHADSSVCTEYEDIPDEVIPQNVECAIVLGGDGTILWAVRALGERCIPILGVNMGTVGFLAEAELPFLYECLDMLLNDQYQVRERLMIEGTIIRDGVVIERATCINDIAICRSGFSRIIRIEAKVNGHIVDTYSADGIVIATPTGSTGYNLSAGGPIVCPIAKTMILTPISPHSLNARSIVLSSEDEIELCMGHIRKNELEEAFVTFDGQYGSRLREGDRILIKKAERITKLVKIKDTSFYDILRRKLGNKTDTNITRE